MSSKYYLQGTEYILPNGVKAEFVCEDKFYLHFIDRSTNILYFFKKSECFDGDFDLLTESKVDKEEASKPYNTYTKGAWYRFHDGGVAEYLGFDIQGRGLCFKNVSTGFEFIEDIEDALNRDGTIKYELACVKFTADLLKPIQKALEGSESTPGTTEQKEVSKDVSEASSKHKHYFKDVSKLEEVDVYAILYLFEVTDPCIAHVVKKLLCTGKRGHKDFERDLQDSIDSLVRCMTLTKLFNQTKE